MRYFILSTVMLFGAALLTACASHEKDYINQSKSVSPLIVPPGAAPLKQESTYPIPQVSTNNLSKQTTSLKPPTLQQ